MKAFTYKKILIAFVLLLTQQTNVQAADYNEVTYDDLLSELKSKTTKIQTKNSSSFDDITIHAGIGYINSFTQLSYEGSQFIRYQNGIQLAMGVDLFSPFWYAEGVFRNFGVTEYQQEELSLREFDLKMGFKNQLRGPLYLNIGTGLANRYLNYHDQNKNIKFNSSSPNWIVTAGLYGQLFKMMSLGVELGAKNAVIPKTYDKGSFDFTIRLNTSL